MLTPIQIDTMIVCASRNVGVPKDGAKLSALAPNQLSPKVDERCACRA